MKETNSSNRRILAEFLDKIPATTGWWYRLPVLNQSIRSIEFETCLPHFGTLFGLNEDAIAIVFVEMGLLNLKKGTDKELTKTMIVKSAWDDLAGEFNVKNLVEVTPVRFKGFNSMWLIRLGSCLFTPAQIWSKKKRSPPKLVTRKTSAFVSEKMISILKKVIYSLLY